MRRTTFTKIRQRLANASAATMFLAAQITAVVMVFMPARTMALDTAMVSAYLLSQRLPTGQSISTKMAQSLQPKLPTRAVRC